MIELHDSEIASFEFDAGTVIITFSHAYVHQSDGVPGVDPGTGWSQRAELRINKASKPDVPKCPPYRVSDGLLKLDDIEYPNEIPIPLSYNGVITLNLLIGNAEYSYSEISIIGSGVELRMIGEAEYIEDYSGLRTD
jgi:hypothetical protein